MILGMNVIIGLLGSWMVVDGLGSIVKYRGQSFLEHFVRAIRTGCGLFLLGYSWLFL